MTDRGIRSTDAAQQPPDLATEARGPSAEEVDFEARCWWLNFWTYLRLPLSTILLGSQATDESYVTAYRLLALALALYTAFVTVGLHRRRLWGWRANWGVLAFDWLGGSAFAAINEIHATTPDPLSALLPTWSFYLALFLVFWVLPNSIYFWKRNNRFADGW